ncbi:hypothetical protein DW961_15355 [Blautia sp. AM46-3MH]|nr:hypothetical protein DW961_15355 [Blautia sp. AM46-3MH]
MGNRRQFLPQRSRACLKNHFRNLQAPLCGIFYPYSVAVARYAALIRIKSPTNWDSQLTKSLFQTRSSQGTVKEDNGILNKKSNQNCSTGSTVAIQYKKTGRP